MLSTSIKRKLFFEIELIIYDSKLILLKSEYSYDQNHWCPKILIDKIGDLISSIKYNKWREGIAMKIRIIGGIIVQINSINWLSIILILMDLFIIK